MENLRNTYMRHIKQIKKLVRLQEVANMTMSVIDGSILPFFSFANTLSNVSEIPRTNEDTNIKYSENILKEDSQPQFPANNSDLEKIHKECEDTSSQNPTFINLAITSESEPALDSTARSISKSAPTRERKRNNESRSISSAESLINYFQNKK